MSAFMVFPAIDLRHGEVVRLKEGDPKQVTLFGTDPLAIALKWLEAGAAWLHVVNLDGAFGDTGDANARALEGRDLVRVVRQEPHRAHREFIAAFGP